MKEIALGKDETTKHNTNTNTTNTPSLLRVSSMPLSPPFQLVVAVVVVVVVLVGACVTRPFCLWEQWYTTNKEKGENNKSNETKHYYNAHTHIPARR